MGWLCGGAAQGWDGGRETQSCAQGDGIGARGQETGRRGVEENGAREREIVLQLVLVGGGGGDAGGGGGRGDRRLLHAHGCRRGGGGGWEWVEGRMEEGEGGVRGKG